MNRILMIPIWHGWYVEAYAEYLIRYLGDEFFMEIGTVPYPPYKNFLDRYPETSPFERSPDDYDLIWPMWAGAWHVIDQDKYAPKVASVFYTHSEGRYKDIAVLGAATPHVEKALDLEGTPYHSLRFGVDTNLFAPYMLVREDDLFHAGYVGNQVNDRHMVKTVVGPVSDISGVRLMIYPSSWVNNGGALDQWDGERLMKYVVTGDKRWTGMPNIYNSLDVLLRIDQDPAYSFPTMEAAACGVPVICTDSGIDHLLCEAGGGILITGDRNYYMNNQADVARRVGEAVIYLKDHPEERQEMGLKARKFVENNWTWDKYIPAWREFFRDGLRKAR